MNSALDQEFFLQTTAINCQAQLTKYLQTRVAKIAGIDADQVDVQQPLNYLGFDSLMAVELRNQLLTELEADIPLLTILEDATVASLVDRVQEKLQEKFLNAKSPSSESEPIIAAADHLHIGRYPLSQGQWGLWFLYRLAPESAAYHVAFTARIRSQVNAPALQKSCQALIDRHPTLRTTYGQEDVEPFQEIHAAQSLEFEQIDATAWDHEILTQRAIGAYQRPFNLESGPVLRMTLLTQKPEEHVLLLTIHHIAVDGLSFGILLDDLRILYQAECVGQPVSLEPIDYQYTDFVESQRKRVQNEVGEQDWNYWKQRLANVPTLMLPADRPYPQIQSDRGACYRFEISEALTAQLRDLAKTAGVTLYITLLTAFQILLHRYTGQEDIVIGTPASGRSQTEFAKTVGFFINMIALRTNLAGNPTFTALLTQVRQTVLEALAHQSYPASVLIERLGVNRDFSQPGLFRASFNLLNLPKMASDFELSVSSRVGTGTRWGDLVLEPFEIPQQEGQNDFVFDVMETTDRLIGIFRYRTDLFEVTTIERMADHFRTLLSGIIANPQQPIAQLPFLTATEQWLLMEWGAPTANYPNDLCIHHLIESQVERVPNTISVVSNYDSLTYSQLNTQANQLARYLQARGVAPEGRVGICLERSTLLLIAVLAVLKAGGAYVPLDPSYPSDRLSFILADAEATLLLTDSALLAALPLTDVPLICLDREWEAIVQEADTNLSSSVQPENLAYIVYTSGSTGKAKGVMIEHRSLVNAYFAWEEAYHLPTLSSHLQMASFSFDVFAGDVVRALGSGGKLVLCPQEWLLEPELLYRLMQEQAIDAAEFGPAVLRNLMQYLRRTGQRFDFMRLLVVGSDAFYLQEFQQLQQLCASETRIINSYGVSEATIDSSYFESTTLDLSNDGLVPIGRPFANTQLLVLDAHQQPVPIGVTGELYIGGAGLARGYLNRPDLNQERFIDFGLPILDCGLESDRQLTPKSSSPAAQSAIQNLKSFSVAAQSAIQNSNPLRLYKTGDLARYLSDGNLEYLGRSDHQVKLRGFRIELGEIEAILTQHPAVWQGIVTVREDALGMKSLVAYVVLEPEQELAIADLRTFLKQKLPDPMLPSAFVVLDTLPLNANGKVDRRALPMPNLFQRDTGVGFVAPRNAIEHRIANIWINILKLDRIGIYDNFFELGGHSLLATQAIAQLRQAFSIELPLRSLFESPTIAQLSEQVESSFHQKQLLAVPAIEPAAHQGELPLSLAQESLWFLDQLEGIGSTYNMPMPLRFTGRLNIAALEQSLMAVIQRHAILRTNFLVREGQPVQVIADDRSLNLPIVNLQNLPDAEQERQLQDRIAAEVQTPFDLVADLLLRATLLQLSKTENVLLITLHHIVADGWSIEIFARELGALYTAFLNDQLFPLPDLPIQYADFALWQRRYLQGYTLELLLAHWQRTLAGAPPVLSLPTDYPRPAVQTFHGKSTSFQLDAYLTESLKSLSQQSQVTLFMTLLAAFNMLLYGYTGQNDLVVGTPIANRNRTEIAGLIGYFVNILVLRTDLSGNPSFRELLARVYQVALDAYTYQDLPFEKLVESLHPERSLSHTPLFQVMFALHNAPTPELQLPDLTIRGLDVDIITSKFDLTLAFRETPQGLQGFVEYNTDLFKAETIDRLMQHYQQLLQTIAANPDRRLSDISLLTPSEYHLLAEWNETQANYPTHQCIHQLFEAQVERTPDAIAVTFAEQQLTYQDLSDRANQLANHLQTQGVAPEVRVGICLDRSIDLLIAVLGVLKAGGTYVPLDPNYPAERLSFMLADTQAVLLLTQQPLLDKLSDCGIHTICLERDWQTIAQANTTNPVNITTPNHLAYIVYTSGSTGKAKGVMIEHLSLVNAFFAWNDAYQLPSLSCHLQMASFSFDVFAGDWVRSLCSGAKLVLCPFNWLLEPKLLYDLMQQQQVDTAEFSPAVVRHLMQYLQQTGQRLDFMRLLIVGSDAFYVQEYQQLQQLCAPETRIINSYGVSEATIDSTYFEPTDESLTNLSGNGLVPIGRPFANTQIYLLNPDLQPVPIGVTGELYIAGAGLARGYLNRPDLSQEKFIPNPFTPSLLYPSPRLYKTGDLARRLSDGTIELLGRSDDQVKLRGFRIEIGEIEAALTQFSDVQAAAVVLHTDSTEDQHLVAYVVPQTTPSTFSTTLLRSFLKEKLPSYMVPGNFVVLDTLPLSPNGKIDYRALPKPDRFQRSTDVGFAAPRSSIEYRILEIWQNVLRLDRVGIYDNFFELGGHSLLATQVMAQLRQAFQIELPLRVLFESPTIAQLAEQIESNYQQTITTLAIEPTVHTGDLPLSFAQESLWFLDQLEGIGPTYNMPMPLRLTGMLNIVALEQSLAALVQRHAILRTTFPTREAQPLQVITSESRLTLPVIDLHTLPEDRRNIEQLIFEEAKERFDLAVGPLMRVALLRLEAQDHVLLITLHHIVADGWSIEIFARELGALYTAFLNHQPSPLPDLPIQYADFAIWQRRYLQGESLELLLAHWQRTLAGAPPVLSLPTDYPRPAVQTFRGSSASFQLDVQLTEAVQTLSQQSKVTLFMTLLTVFQILLRNYSGQEDIVVGTPIANRNRAETAGLIGYFVNILVLRTDLSGNPSFRELLTRVYQVALDAYTYQDLPFEKLVESLHPERSLSHTPLFQVMFVLQNAPTPELNLPDLTIRGLDIDIITSKFDLTLALRETAQGLQGFVEYNTDLFTAETIDRLMGHYQQLLRAIAANPERRLSELSLLTPIEQHLLVQWNKTQVEYPRDFCIHQLFEVQVDRSPNAIAVVFAEQTLTYSELNTQANQLARYLQAQGIAPEMRVGICLERSIHLLVAVLGILKAGAAYVPLDPNYPTERLSFMLADAQPALLLTESKLLTTLPSTNVPLFCLDRDWDKIAQLQVANLTHSVQPENLAYVVYTSGSTGKAKGVMIEHRSLVNAFFAWHDAYQLSRLSCHLQMASFSFDVFAGDWVRSLCSGAKLVLCPHDFLLEPALLYDLMQQHQVDTAEFSPAVVRQLIQYLQQTYQRLDFMRLLVVGSDAFYLQEYQQLQQLCAPETRIINSYGVSEATIDSTYFETTDANLSIDSLVPIGRSFANTQIYLLNPDLQPVPIGVTGELYIAGAGLARGYVNQPELTQERFIDFGLPILDFGLETDSQLNPKSSSVAAQGAIQNLKSKIQNPKSLRLYKTGDLARYLSDGTIELLGRSDDQVKLRGFRIEIGEIEAVLSQHPEVREAAVVLRTDAAGDKQLVAYVVPQNLSDPAEESVNVSLLRGFLKAELPNYMVPTHFVALETMPLTPNGKIDRLALPAPEFTRPELTDNFVPPTTAIETTLAAIWTEILQVSQIGVNDNFFDLGGHSLLATSLVFRIRQAFAIDFPLRHLFVAPTIAALSPLIEQLKTDRENISEDAFINVAMSRLERTSKTLIPLSFSQQYIWQMHQADRTGAGLNSSLLLRFRGGLSPEILEQSLNEIIRRHEILRTVFTMIGDQPMQMVLPSLSLSLIYQDLQHLPLEMRESEAVKAGIQIGQRPFDLFSAPLLRVVLFRLNPEEHWLLMTMHHIITDGWSFGLVLQELDTLIRAFSNGLVSPLAEVSFQYADFAAWQKQVYNEAAIARQLTYWRHKLVESAPQSEAALGLTQYGKQAGHYFTRLSEPIAIAIQTLSREQRVTSFVILLAALKLALATWSNQNEILVIATIGNRTVPETERMIGCFINDVILRSQIMPEQMGLTLIQQLQGTVNEAIDHKEVPLQQVINQTQRLRPLNFLASITMTSSTQDTEQLPGWEAIELQTKSEQWNNSIELYDETTPLELYVGLSQTVQISVNYSLEIFNSETIDRFFTNYRNILTQLITHPETPILNYTLTSGHDRIDLH